MQLDARLNGAHRTYDAHNGQSVDALAREQTPSTESPLRSRSARPAHRVPHRNADPAIISSMISSLDAFEVERSPSSRATAERKTHGVRSDFSAPRSISNPASRQNLPLRSQSDHREIGIALEYQQQHISNSPSAPSPSANSRIIAATSPRYPGPASPVSLRNASSQNPLRPRPSSRGSTFSTASTQTGRQNKLSSESWVRQGLQEDNAPASPPSIPPPRALRRKGSQKSLRPANLNTLPVRANTEQEGASPIAGEHIVVAPKSPGKVLSPKGRLFLRDSLIAENETVPESSLDQVSAPEQRLVIAPDLETVLIDRPVAPPAHSQTPHEAPRILRAGSVATTISNSDISQSSPRITTSNGTSPIIDSIPTRTSSLRQSSRSPAKRKEKSSKKKSMLGFAKTESVFARRHKPIPESSWADLGEDDETVKRIRELREIRENRLQKIQNETFPGYTAPFVSSEAASTSERSPRRDPSPRPDRPTPGDRTLSAPSKVERVLGIGSDEGMSLSRTRSRDDVALKVNPSTPGSRRPSPAPSDRRVPTKMSLEQSHNETVAAGHGTPIEKPKPTIEVATHILPVPSPPSRKTTWEKGEKSPRQATTPKSELIERRKSRRKSMSDARNRRVNEEGSALQRRDSLEDSVMEYLNSPRLTQLVESKSNRRKIAYSEVGDPNGAVVFVCVGMGLTRYVTVFYDELATTLRLRLITLDRPGVGGSGPYPANDKSGPLSWPDDIMAICQHLGITKFSLLAHSAGAIYALATSLILPQMLIGKVHLLAPWIPASQLEVVPHQTTSASPAGGLPRSQRFLRVLPTPFLRAANATFMSPTSVSVKSKKNVAKLSAAKGPRQSGDTPRSPLQARERSVSQDNRRESMMLMDQFMPMANPLEAYSDTSKDGNDFDPALKRGSLVLSATAFPTDPSFSYAASALNAAEHTEKERQAHYTKQLTERTWELATRDSNPATDLLVCLERHRDIGFRYTDVKRQIVITHGIEDKRVPAANIRWLADQMNRQAQAIPGSSYAHAPPSRDGWADAANARGGCEVRILQGEGHGLMASPSIMSDVLTEIAGYWVGHDKGYVQT